MKRILNTIGTLIKLARGHLEIGETDTLKLGRGESKIRKKTLKFREG